MSDPIINVSRAELSTKLNHHLSALVATDSRGFPDISREEHDSAIGTAHRLGQLDGQEPPPANPLHTPPLPGEATIAGCIDVAATEVGQLVIQKLQLAEQGKLLDPPAATPTPRGLHAAWATVKRHGVLAIVIIVVYTVEFLVGRVIMGRLFGVDNSTGTILALAIPTAIAIVFLTLAQAVFSAKPGLASRMYWPAAILGTAFIVVWVIAAAMGFGGVIAPPTGLDEPSASYKAVRMIVYIALMFGMNLTVFAAHLMDLVREDRRAKELAHALGKAALTPEAVRAANQVYLRQYLDLYEQLLSVRSSIVNAYTQGARDFLPSTVATAWNVERLEADPPPPRWVAQLRQALGQ